jgi:multicomponent K+:H+ antiporter subunit D
LVERRVEGDRVPPPDVDLQPGEDTNLDDDLTPLVGRAFPVSLALLGLAFIACALLIAGLPPLSGFIAKVALMTALLNTGGPGAANTPAPTAWWLLGLLLVSGLVASVSMSRAGIRHFWSTADSPLRRIRIEEVAPVLALILACAWLTVQAEPVMRFTRAAAAAVHSPSVYIDAVLSAKPVPRLARPSH